MLYGSPQIPRPLCSVRQPRDPGSFNQVFAVANLGERDWKSDTSKTLLAWQLHVPVLLTFNWPRLVFVSTKPMQWVRKWRRLMDNVGILHMWGLSLSPNILCSSNSTKKHSQLLSKGDIQRPIQFTSRWICESL